MGRSFSNKTPALFYFQKGEGLFDAIFYEVHTPVRRRGADDDATPSSASQKRTHPQQLSLQCRRCALQRRLRDELNRQPFRFFLSDAHRERWTHWKNRCCGMSERNAAALFLLTADEELWQRVLWHFDSSGFDFPAIRLSGIHPELYSIYQAAKTISVGGDNIVIEDLAFSELVSDRAFQLILGALLLCRYGEVVLNLERKTEEIT